MENILSVDDQNFLENIHKNFGIRNAVCDESGINFSTDLVTGNHTLNESNSDYLNQIFKKLKYRINSDFKVEFSATGFNISITKTT